MQCTATRSWSMLSLLWASPHAPRPLDPSLRKKRVEPGKLVHLVITVAGPSDLEVPEPLQVTPSQRDGRAEEQPAVGRDGEGGEVRSGDGPQPFEEAFGFLVELVRVAGRVDRFESREGMALEPFADVDEIRGCQSEDADGAGVREDEVA